MQPKPRPLVIETLCRFLHTDALTCKHDSQAVAQRQAKVNADHMYLIPKGQLAHISPFWSFLSLNTEGGVSLPIFSFLNAVYCAYKLAVHLS